jgi:hypothetical protein
MGKRTHCSPLLDAADQSEIREAIAGTLAILPFPAVDKEYES